MENIFREYFEKSFPDPEGKKLTSTSPVITISREFGCPSKLVGQQLTELLNKRSEQTKARKWRFINKEIVLEAARELELKLTDMNYLLSSGSKGFMEDILTSFTQPYVNQHRIRKTITRVITAMALKGYVVIVGRGGVGVLQGCTNAIHIRLQAPLKWRIPEICKLRNISETEARKLAQETDHKRTDLIEMMLKDKFHPYLFHLTFNCSTLSIEEIVHTIAALAETKKMIPGIS